MQQPENPKPNEGWEALERDVNDNTPAARPPGMPDRAEKDNEGDADNRYEDDRQD